MSQIENDQHEICFVSVFFASLQRHFYGFYGYLNLYFFPKLSLHFLKFLRHERVKQASKIYQFISKWPNIG